MKSLISAHSHLKEERQRNLDNKKISQWWDNLPITKQQSLFWKLKGIKNINVKQFINDYDKYRLYIQEH